MTNCIWASTWELCSYSIYKPLEPIGIHGQVWYLIVSIPDLCTFTY